MAELAAETPMEQDPEYQAWLDEIAKHCNCCPLCFMDIPCGGVMAGGLCDGMCICQLHEDDDHYDEDDR